MIHITSKSLALNRSRRENTAISRFINRSRDLQMYENCFDFHVHMIDPLFPCRQGQLTKDNCPRSKVLRYRAIEQSSVLNFGCARLRYSYVTLAPYPRHSCATLASLLRHSCASTAPLLYHSCITPASPLRHSYIVIDPAPLLRRSCITPTVTLALLLNHSCGTPTLLLRHFYVTPT